MYIQTVLRSSTHLSYSLITKKGADNQTILYSSVDILTAKWLKLPGYVQAFAKWYTPPTQGSKLKVAVALVFNRSSGSKQDVRMSSRVSKWRHIRTIMRFEQDGFLPDIVTAHVNLKGLARFTTLAHRCSGDDVRFAHVLGITARELLEDTLPRYQQNGYLLRYLDTYTHKGREIKYVALFHLRRKATADHPLITASTRAEAERIAEEKVAAGYTPIVAARVGDIYLLQFDRKL